MSENKILVGYEAEVAEEARVPLFHMILTGITQHGKTEELKRVVTEAQGLGYTVLIIDVKDKPEGEESDFEGFGVDVPIYIAGIADTLSLYGLLESHSGLPLRRELPELARACKRGKKLRRAYEILKELLDQEKIHPVRKDRIEILVLVLEGLIAEMDKVKPTSKLQLKKGEINVMNLTGRSMGFKQLAVNDAVTYIRKYFPKTITVFDEAHQQIPQGYGSGSKRTVTSAIKEGAGSQQYIWVADQTIKEVDKDVIAQIPIKIYGGQPGAKLRAKETLDHLPVKTWRDRKIDEEFIMRLKTGFFIVGERDQTRLVYALPVWMPAPLARLVAEGKCSPETAKEICDLLSGVRVQIKPVEKPEAYERLKVDYDKTKKELGVALDNVKELEGKVEDLKYLEEWKAKYGGKFEQDKERIEKLEEEKRQLVAELENETRSVDNLSLQLKETAESYEEKIENLKKDAKVFNEFRELLAKIVPVARVQIPAPAPIPSETAPSEISVSTEQPAISVKVQRKPLILTDEDLRGKIAVVYAEGKLGDGWFTVTDANKEFQSHGWPRDPRASKFLDQFCQWGYFEKKYAGRKPMYRVRMKPEEAEAKGLLKVEKETT